jgi:HPt (histidine-containing phosphotransfer) domain-containing protein
VDGFNHKDVLDREAALDRMGGDQELLKEIALLFLGDYPKLIEKLRQAVEQSDAVELERAAHALKGSVANFSARTAVKAALTLEEMGRSGNLAGAREALATLESVFEALRPELQALAV